MLALKSEEGAASRGMRAASRSWKRKVPVPWKGTQPW